MTTTTVFTNNRSQAVRLPSDLRLPEGVKQVNVRALGHERIISPLAESWDSFFLSAPSVSQDFMETRAAQDQVPRESL
jgi:antitoxin VapB